MLIVNYCPRCKRYTYNSSPKPKECKFCDIKMRVLEMEFQQFVNLRKSERRENIDEQLERESKWQD